MADIMRRTRAKYHYTIRSVKKSEQDIINERFAQTILNRTDRDFWYEVKRIRSNKTPVSYTHLTLPTILRV